MYAASFAVTTVVKNHDAQPLGNVRKGVIQALKFVCGMSCKICHIVLFGGEYFVAFVPSKAIKMRTMNALKQQSLAPVILDG